MHGRSPSHPALLPYARRTACGPPPLARRRLLDRRRFTLDDPDSSSIAGRRASGFLQVSLSKVPRPQHRAHISALCAEALPINASDYWGLSAFSGDRQYPKAGGCLLRSSDSNPGQSDRSRDIGAEGDRGALLTASPTAGPSSTKRLGRPWAAGRRARAAASRSGRGATGCASPSASTPRRR